MAKDPTSIARSIIQAALTGDASALARAWSQVNAGNAAGVSVTLKQATPAEQVRMNHSFDQNPNLWQSIPTDITAPIVGKVPVRSTLQDASGKVAVSETGPQPHATPPTPQARPALTQTASLPQLPAPDPNTPSVPQPRLRPTMQQPQLAAQPAVLVNGASAGPVPPVDVGPGAGSQSQAIVAEAKRIGANPLDLSRVISYETEGTFSPAKWGGKNGDYLGLIQFGPSERKTYGVTADQSFEDQVSAAGNYLQDRGFKPGMGLAEMYSIVNAGSLKNGQPRWNRSDGNGTVRQHVARMESGAYDTGPVVEMAGYTTTTGNQRDWVLRPGMGSAKAPDPRVEALQTGLNQAGANLRTDGVYGRVTQTAVRAYEKAHDLTVDRGVAGQEVLGHLHENGLLPEPLTASGQLPSSGMMTFTPGQSLELVPQAGQQPPSTTPNSAAVDPGLRQALARGGSAPSSLSHPDTRFSDPTTWGPQSGAPDLTAAMAARGSRYALSKPDQQPSRPSLAPDFSIADSTSAPRSAGGGGTAIDQHNADVALQQALAARTRPALSGSVGTGTPTAMTFTPGQPLKMMPQLTGTATATGTPVNRMQGSAAMPQTVSPPLPQLRPQYQPQVVKPASLLPTLGATINPRTGQPVQSQPAQTSQPVAQRSVQRSSVARPALVSSQTARSSGAQSNSGGNGWKSTGGATPGYSYNTQLGIYRTPSGQTFSLGT